MIGGPRRRGPKSWTSSDEETFLRSKLPAYIACQVTRTYTTFWADTFYDFFDHWPERARLCNVPLIGDLTNEQECSLEKAIKKRQSVGSMITL
jgi:hypothetical protein